MNEREALMGATYRVGCPLEARAMLRPPAPVDLRDRTPVVTWRDVPKAPRVERVEDHWTLPPPQLSPRCVMWLARFDLGWRPNRRIRSMGYYEAAEWYGVWIWEHISVLTPASYAR